MAFTTEQEARGDGRQRPLPAGDRSLTVLQGGSDGAARERRQRPHGLPRVTVVIPTLNEERNLVHVLPGVPSWVDEVVIVDGRSSDGTVAEALRLLPHARIVLEAEKGKGRALFAGIRAATGDLIVALDADGSMAAEDIPRYVYALMAGADYVKGSRFVHGANTQDMTFARKLGNRGLTEVVRRMYGGRYSDLCYGYFGFWRDVVPYLEGRAPGFEVETHINVRALAAGLQVVEVPSFEAERIFGVSNLNTFRDGSRVLRKILTERHAFRESTLPVPLPSRLPVAPPSRRGELRVEAAAPARPSVAVAICTHDPARWDSLVRAVDAVLDQSVPADEVLVVVDHHDELRRRVELELPGVRVVANARGRGLSGARNTAIAEAGDDVVAFLDDDAWPERDWLERLLAAYDDQRVVGVGGTVEPHWVTGRPAWFPDELDWVVGCTYRGLPTVRAEVRNAIGANMSFRRKALVTSGGFSELLGRVGHDAAGCEETELCIRLRQQDPMAKVLFEPAARVRHEVSAERATFEYFAKRCRAEGRSKATVSQLVGEADGLRSERTYLTRTLPVGVLRTLGPLARLEATGLAQAGTLAAGAGLVGSSYVRARRQIEAGPAAQPAPARRQVGATALDGARSAATGVVDLDLSAALPDLTGIPPLGARCLVRVHGRPIGVIDLDGGAPGLAAADLARQVELGLRAELAAEVARLGAEPQGLAVAGLVVPPPDAPSSEPVPVTVVVATRDRAEVLDRCLAGVLAATPPPAAVVVVDNASVGGATREVVERRAGGAVPITYVREDRPGLGRAHNAALPHVATPYVAFTDDDVVVDPAWVGAIADAFEATDDVACVTGLIAPVELLTREQWWVERAAGFGKGFRRRVRSLADLDGESALFPFDAGTFGSGANMAFATAALLEAGGFDRSLGAGTVALGGDDLAALHSVVADGHALVYEPAAVVFHRHHADLAALRRQAFGYGAGLTAYLTHVVVERPGSAAAVVRRVAPGVARALLPSSDLNARRPSDYPSRLVWRERAGMLAGPARYAWQRRIDRSGGAR